MTKLAAFFAFFAFFALDFARPAGSADFRKSRFRLYSVNPISPPPPKNFGDAGKKKSRRRFNYDGFPAFRKSNLPPVVTDCASLIIFRKSARVNDFLGQRGQVLIGFAFLFQRLLQKVGRLLFAQKIRERADGAVGRDLVVFDTL